MDLEAETTQLLQRLLRHRTVNPPGDERPLQEELARDLEQAGFEVELLGVTAARPNLVARLRGAGEGPTLCLLSHCDTVLATPEDWQRDPWSGDVVDGEVWGRGAQDMKSQTAAEAAAAISLAREGWRPARGELLVVVVVDEETGGENGAIWLTETHPDKVRCDYLLNEGAGTVIPHDGGRLYGVCVAEKGVFRFTLTTRGAAGHASMPNIADNALLKLAPLVQALGERRPSQDVTDAPRLFLEALGTTHEELRERDPMLAAVLEPALGVTFAPTMAAASEKINVIPAAARLQVDCRVPPGLGEETARERLREILGPPTPDGYELEFSERVVGNGSPAESPLMDAIRGWIGREDPEARVVPVMLPAYTDSRAFRDAFPGLVAYGFFPQREKSLYEAWPLVHGKDERIDVRDLGFAARFYRDVSKELLG
ncbi:MAG TPA: M20/M25/M40 family metallo-hydrolase [Solirubrobacteraceae bacterium]|nr:M20/M25/M40 family metallo-hydrolase [Solirubrobacteraceae bacterium]